MSQAEGCRGMLARWQHVARWQHAGDGAQLAPRMWPVVVFFDGATYWLADGFHRWNANRKIGATTIAVAVRPGSQRDAVLFLIGANGSHGLPPNNADKRKAVMVLLGDAEWSV